MKQILLVLVLAFGCAADNEKSGPTPEDRRDILEELDERIREEESRKQRGSFYDDYNDISDDNCPRYRIGRGSSGFVFDSDDLSGGYYHRGYGMQSFGSGWEPHGYYLPRLRPYDYDSYELR